MKFGGNVITYYWNDDKEPDRLRDVFTDKLISNGVIKVHDYWTIEDESKKIVGAFLSVSGPKLLVDFLSKLTDLTFHVGNKVTVSTTEDGTISACKNHES